MSFSPPMTPSTPSSRTSRDDVSTTMLKLIHLFIENEIELFERTCEQIKDLCDGVILYSLMHILIPTHFPLNKIKTDAGTNPSHRAHNIRALLDEMSKFLHSEVLTDATDITKSMDVDAIISCSPPSISSLLELIMFCAIHSPSKEDVVTNILTMSDSEQSQLMHMIESIQMKVGTGDVHEIENFDLIATPARQRSDGQPMTPGTEMKISPFTPTSGNSPSHSTRHHDTHRDTHRHADHEMLREMETEKQALREQFDMVTRENKTLQKSVHELNTKIQNIQQEMDKRVAQAVNDAIENAEQRYHEQRKTDSSKHQTSLSTLEERLNEMSSTLKTITAERDALNREKKRHMEEIEEWKMKWGKQKDELELSKETAKKLIQTEAKLQHYKQKLEESSEYKQQYQEADEENARNLATIVSLEAELKQTESVKQQMLKYKQQVVEMSQAATESRIQQEELQAQLQSLKEEITTLTTENRNKTAELTAIRNELEKTKLQSQQTQKAFEPLSGGLTPEIKQKIIRLEAENKQLRESGAGDGSLADLKNDLDVAKSVAQANEEKYLAARRQVLSLENQLKKAQEQLQTATESATQQSMSVNNVMQQEAASAAEEIQRLRAEKIQMEETIQLLRQNPASTGSAEADAEQAVKTQEKLLALLDRNKKLEAYIKQQQSNMKKVKESVMKKQSEIIQTQEALKKLKALCEQREHEIAEFDKLRIDDKMTYNRERKLLTAAFYSIGMEYQSALMAGRARDGNAKAPASWLSKQRAKPGQ